VELSALNISKRAGSAKSPANSYPTASFISPFADLRLLFIKLDCDRDKLLGHYALLPTCCGIQQC